MSDPVSLWSSEKPHRQNPGSEHHTERLVRNDRRKHWRQLHLDASVGQHPAVDLRLDLGGGLDECMMDCFAVVGVVNYTLSE